jgi:hypothetical protein
LHEINLCRICKIEFKTRGILNNHLDFDHFKDKLENLVEGNVHPYTCSKCSMTSKLKWYVAKHISNEHGLRDQLIDEELGKDLWRNGRKEKKRAHDDDVEDDSDTEDEAEVDEPMEQTTQEQEENEAAETVIKPPEAKKARVEKTVVTAKAVNETEFESFKTALFAAFEVNHLQQLPMEDVRKAIFEKTSLSEGQLITCIEKMTDLNKVMMASDVLYLI